MRWTLDSTSMWPYIRKKLSIYVNSGMSIVIQLLCWSRKFVPRNNDTLTAAELRKCNNNCREIYACDQTKTPLIQEARRLHNNYREIYACDHLLSETKRPLIQVSGVAILKRPRDYTIITGKFNLCL